MRRTDKPFSQALHEVRGDRKVTEIAWHIEALARERDGKSRTGASRSSFEKHSAGNLESPPSTVLLRRVAEVLGIDASYFVEYRLWLARRQLDARPSEEGGVGFAAAVANLAKISELLDLDATTGRDAAGVAEALQAEAERAPRRAGGAGRQSP